MNQVTVKVSFYLKKSEADADGMCPVMAKLNVGKYSEAAFSVKLRVPQSMWYSGRASGKSVKAKEINNLTVQLKIIVGEAIADGIITVHPFAGYEPMCPKQKKRYLTAEELQRIMTTPLHKSHLYLTRDMFLFSCYTGIPYSDMKNLVISNYGRTHDYH